MTSRAAMPEWAALYRRGLEAYGRGEADVALLLLEKAVRQYTPGASQQEARLRCGLGGVLRR